MAIVRESYYGNILASSGPASSLSLNYTVASVANGFLAVSCGAYSTDITGVTANGTAMTQGNVSTFDSACGKAYNFYLMNPPSGTYNIIASAANGSNVIQMTAALYSGVLQSGLDATNTGQLTSNATSATMSLTTVADNSWIVGAWVGSGNYSAGTGTTLLGNNVGVGQGQADSGAAETPAGSHSIVLNGNNGHWSWAVISLAPAVAVPTNQTQTGKSRITVTNTQTQTGKSRITVTTPKTQTGKSRITATTSQTQTGKANVINGTLKLQNGKASILGTTSKTQTGKANILLQTAKTQTGKANLVMVTAKTQTGKAAIIFQTKKTQTGKASVLNGTFQTQQGKAYVYVPTNYTSKYVPQGTGFLPKYVRPHF